MSNSVVRKAVGETGGAQIFTGYPDCVCAQSVQKQGDWVLKPGASGGRSGSWRNCFPTFCVFCPVFRRKPECFCRKRGVFHRYFPTALFFSSIMSVIACLIYDYLFDRICDLFESTIRFA